MMLVKEYLCRYHLVIQKIEKLQGLVDLYIRLANEIPGMKYDQIRVDGGKNLKAPFEKWILKALDYEEEIKQLKLQLPLIKAEIVKKIDELADTEHKKTLIYRYLDNHSWNEIAALMYVSLSTLKRWHKSALETLQKMDHDGPS